MIPAVPVLTNIWTAFCVKPLAMDWLTPELLTMSAVVLVKVRMAAPEMAKDPAPLANVIDLREMDVVTTTDSWVVPAKITSSPATGAPVAPQFAEVKNVEVPAPPFQVRVVAKDGVAMPIKVMANAMIAMNDWLVLFFIIAVLFRIFYRWFGLNFMVNISRDYGQT